MRASEWTSLKLSFSVNNFHPQKKAIQPNPSPDDDDVGRNQGSTARGLRGKQC